MPSIINATTTNGVAISPDNSGSLQLATNNGTTAVTIDTNQNVGIGTTNPPNYSSSLLTVAFNKSGGVVHNYNVNDTRTGSIVCQSGGFDIGTYTANTPLVLSTNSTQRMVINSSGNVGIGTSSQTAKLTVAGGVQIVNGSPSFPTSGFGIELVAGLAGGTNYIQAYNRDNASWQTLYIGGFQTIFGTNGTDRMQIDSLGSLLLNTSSNGYGVTGGIYAPSVYNFTTASAANMFIESGGFFRRSTSSIKYKTDVQDATHGLADVMKLRPVTYKGINDGETVFGGLIAEEVHDAGLTEFVQYADDGSPDALAYGQMVSLCVKAIQEQQAMIETLKTELDSVKAELNTLKNPPVEGTE